jgi:proteasome activator subunit 4
MTKVKGSRKFRKVTTSEATPGDEQQTTAADKLSHHSGILGLCAFVEAFPYDVPSFVPPILMELSTHLNDPQPTPLTIKKSLQEFKRTHQDNWQEHKTKFTEDQLVVMTDLLVSHNYYA